MSYQVVDLENAADGLCGQSNSADWNQQWLNHQLLQDVRDTTLKNIINKHYKVEKEEVTMQWYQWLLAQEVGFLNL